MPCSSGLLLPTTIFTPSKSKKSYFFPPPPPPSSTTTRTLKFSSRFVACSKSSSSSNSITEFDLYDLLGIDSTSDQSQIKMAYRSLQKRCHPDIAGSAGHDMAIILNDAYSILSNPSSRSAYDKEQAKFTEFRGYTGKPLYSSWLGSDKEERAVFVDEVKCVGCLKCALFAKNTFAIESSYGRARVVAQWADSEDQIYDAIQTCPVDCISMVERSDLAALEFLMSKQPRGNVRMSAGNTVGARVSNIFVDVKKFQGRFHEVKSESSEQDSRESDLLREARMSAIHAIRSISNLWYWQWKGGKAAKEGKHNLILIAAKSSLPGTEKLHKAAAARQKATMQNMESKRPVSSNQTWRDEYWTPKTLILPPPLHQNSETTLESTNTSTSSTKSKFRNSMSPGIEKNNRDERNPLKSIFPVGVAIIAFVVIKLRAGEELVSGGGGAADLRDHVAGSLATEIVNSLWLQTILAGVTWYVIGIMMVELIDVLRSKR